MVPDAVTLFATIHRAASDGMASLAFLSHLSLCCCAFDAYLLTMTLSAAIGAVAFAVSGR